jgi:hypothetical protein
MLVKMRLSNFISHKLFFTQSKSICLSTIGILGFLLPTIICGNVVCKYSTGKVEVLDENNTGVQALFNLEPEMKLSPTHIVCSGARSRSQLETDDFQVRAGANTVIGIPSANTIWIHSGSLLLWTKKHTIVNIKSITASALFSGEGTIIVETTSNGGFKLIPLTAKGVFKTEKGRDKEAKSGQLLFVLGNPAEFGNAYDIDLLLLLRSSLLINAFEEPLPTSEKIGLAIYAQQMLLHGKYDALIGDAPTDQNIQLWTLGKSGGKDSQGTSKGKNKTSLFRRIFGNKKRE